VGAGQGDRAPVVVVVRREYRALGRELRYGPVLRRRSLLGRVVGWLLRHLPEILLLVLLIHLWQITAEQIEPLWTNIVIVAMAVGLVWWRRSRRWLIGVLGCMLTRARLRAAFAELRLSRKSGQLPVTLALVPTAVGERVWLCCPIGVCAEDIADETDRLRAACFAREIRITRDRRFSALVVVEVIRRDPLAATAPIPSPLGRFDVPHPRHSR
jgi:branched-subunit amino acid transport protein